MSDLSGGAIAGICIGIIFIVAFIIFVVFFCLRFRHYWPRRNHTKMPAHLTDVESMGTANKYFSNDITTQHWKNDPFYANPMYFPPGQPNTLPGARLSPEDNSRFRSSSDGSAGLAQEPYLVAKTVSPLQAGHVAPGRMERVRHYERAATVGAYHLGDLSMANTNAFQLYPRLSEERLREFRSVEEPGASTTDSSGNQSSKDVGKSKGQKLRSKVRRMSGVTQLSRFPSRRRSKKSRTKRKSRLSNVGIDSEHSGGGSPPFGDDTIDLGIGEHGSYIDELGSLDNDAFLNSIESAAFPSPSVESCYGQRPSQNSGVNRVHFLAAMGPTQPDLSNHFTQEPLGGFQTLTYPHTYRPYSNFRFPEPGPPVAGWAYQFLQTPPSLATTSPITESQPRSQNNIKADSVPLLIGPPSAHAGVEENVSRRTGSTDSALSTYPRRRGSKSNSTRQHSEPRKLSRDSTNPCVNPTKPSEYGFNSNLVTSLSTLESVVVDLADADQVYKTHEPNLDSGYQDSVNYSTTSIGLSHSNPHTGRQTPEPKKLAAKPKLIDLCKMPIDSRQG